MEHRSREPALDKPGQIVDVWALSPQEMDVIYKLLLRAVAAGEISPNIGRRVLHQIKYADRKERL